MTSFNGIALIEGVPTLGSTTQSSLEHVYSAPINLSPSSLKISPSSENPTWETADGCYTIQSSAPLSPSNRPRCVFGGDSASDPDDAQMGDTCGPSNPPPGTALTDVTQLVEAIQDAENPRKRACAPSPASGVNPFNPHMT